MLTLHCNHCDVEISIYNTLVARPYFVEVSYRIISSWKNNVSINQTCIVKLNIYSWLKRCKINDNNRIIG
jgi:hypothetical protein